MTDLLVIVPTRGRPERFGEFLHAWYDTATGDTQLLACLDIDDPTMSDYPQIDPNVGRYAIEDRNGFAPRLNAAAIRCVNGDQAPYAVASLNDDHLPRTTGWDEAMVFALARMGSGIVYPNDLLQYEALPTAPAISADIIRALGWMSPPFLRHVYIDNFWRALGIRLERLRYLPDVIVEHMHPQAALPDNPDGRKARWDATYESGSANELVVADCAAWDAYRAGLEFTADIERVRKAIE